MVYKQLKVNFNRYGKSIDEIVLNSFMDLCVKFKIPDDAIQIYEMTKGCQWFDEPRFRIQEELFNTDP